MASRGRGKLLLQSSRRKVPLADGGNLISTDSVDKNAGFEGINSDYKRFAEDGGCDSPPLHIPNSQAPIPDRDVYWDFGTPENKRKRDLLRERSPSTSPLCKSTMLTPRLRLVAIPKKVNPAIAAEGEKELEQLEELCRKAALNKGQNRDLAVDKNENNKTAKCDNESTNFEGDEDMFGDDNDEKLLQASLTPVPALGSAILSSTHNSRLRTSAVKQETAAFDSPNDSFDDFLSQVKEEPESSSPILKKSKFMAEPTEVLPPPAPSSSYSREKKVEGSGKRRDSIIHKCSSFSADSPNTTKKKLFSKYKTDPYIEVKLERKPICTKEEIERKRKEALAKKRLSQSQNKK